jgi:hypothetical protein
MAPPVCAAVGCAAAPASFMSFSMNARWSLICLRKVTSSGLTSQAGAAAAVAGGAGTRACSDGAESRQGANAAKETGVNAISQNETLVVPGAGRRGFGYPVAFLKGEKTCL